MLVISITSTTGRQTVSELPACAGRTDVRRARGNAGRIQAKISERAALGPQERKAGNMAQAYDVVALAYSAETVLTSGSSITAAGEIAAARSLDKGWSELHVRESGTGAMVAVYRAGVTVARAADGHGKACADCGQAVLPCAHSFGQAWDHVLVAGSGKCAGLLTSFAVRAA
jgi:hypothetical protein